jgi:hypothetical protein
MIVETSSLEYDLDAFPGRAVEVLEEHRVLLTAGTEHSSVFELVARTEDRVVVGERLEDRGERYDHPPIQDVFTLLKSVWAAAGGRGERFPTRGPAEPLRELTARIRREIEQL